MHRLSPAVVLVALLLPGVAQATDYRTVSTSGLPPPPVSTPPEPPEPLCSELDPANLEIDCSDTADWARITTPDWALGQPAELASWTGDVASWTVASFNAAVEDEFVFLGPEGTTTATIHVHDDVAAADLSVVFVVKGGPAGERWLCKHACSVPDTGFRVSIDPLDVPPNVWLGQEGSMPLPNVPAVTGTITVTFS